MTRRLRLQIFTLIENFSSALIGLGAFFYAKEKLGFTDGQNLAMGLAVGVSFVTGAILSHPLSARIGERRQLFAVLGLTLATHVTMGLFGSAWVLVCGAVLLNSLNGLKWPVLESYVTAGLTPEQTNRELAWFNPFWSGMQPVAMFLIGPIISAWSPGLFFLAACINTMTLLLITGLEREPVHLPEDHPERPDENAMARLRTLLISSRWSLVLAFMLLAALNPLLPGIFQRMGFTVGKATALASVGLWARFVAFVVMGWWTDWHNRSWPLTAALLLSPIGFVMVLAEHDVASVLAGLVVFGVTMGVAYYAALYYAMVVKNASVDAGGHHEAIIGCGFLLGPVAALAGRWGGESIGGSLAQTVVGIGPVVACFVAAGVWPLLGMTRGGAKVAGTSEPERGR
jgi:MFS family permease